MTSEESGKASSLPWYGWALLVLAPALAFLPVLGNDFVKWDDMANLHANRDFRGLGWEAIRWAWTHSHVGEYRPFAWHLFALQHALWGWKAAGYHAVALAIHLAVTVILYRVVLRLVERADRSFFERHGGLLRWVAALGVTAFQVHPLRTEPIAWISIQSYLPSTFSYLLALYVYLGPARRNRRVAGALGCFVISLLFKVVSVPLPLVLLILDFSLPARDLEPTTRARLILEKAPFFLVALLFAGLALWAKQQSHSLEIFDGGPWARIAQPAYTLVFFLVKLVFPWDLRAIYSLPAGMSWGSPLFVLCVLSAVGITGAIFWMGRRLPFLLAAWLVYLVTLAPNLGVVKASFALTADRYGYLPLMALLPLAIYTLSRVLAERPRWLSGGLALAVGAIGGWGILSWQQSLTWRSTESLWLHALSVGETAPEVHTNLAADRLDRGDLDGAYPHLIEALRQRPTHRKALHNLGLLYFQRNQPDQAKSYLEAALGGDPTDPMIRSQLGLTYLKLGKKEQGNLLIDQAVRQDPRNPEIQIYRGVSLAMEKKFEEAETHFAEALRLRPSDANAARNLAQVKRDRKAARD